ncbi:MAG: tRNA pseudouridine(38-40) synthase TruA [Candidatus Eremiobacteraeota bacterium]|nr:tRNA pseudouridine(38-40) synthase TruA [Candidatus Eremiobacteraeota bacterium]
MTVEYDGTDFCGFQWQPNLRTVAGVLEITLARLFSHPVKLTAAGRTDGGVHATGQVVSLATSATFPFERLLPALQALLPADCSVRRAEVVPEGFSARFSAVERTYCYAISNRREPSPLLSRYAAHESQPLDLAAMRAAAEHLVGEHDFRSFSALGDGAPTTIRRVGQLRIAARGELVGLQITAGGFLHHMVRTIAGTLIECGVGRRRPAEMPGILAALDRRAAGATAPPQGLYLAGVRYADGYDSYADPPALRGFAEAALDGPCAFP